MRRASGPRSTFSTTATRSTSACGMFDAEPEPHQRAHPAPGPEHQFRRPVLRPHRPVQQPPQRLSVRRESERRALRRRLRGRDAAAIRLGRHLAGGGAHHARRLGRSRWRSRSRRCRSIRATTTWRMNFARNIARKAEGMAWISRNRNTDLSTMGDVTGISQIEQGRGLDVVPSMSVRERRAIGTTAAESATEPSVDVFYKITPQLNASLTREHGLLGDRGRRPAGQPHALQPVLPRAARLLLATTPTFFSSAAYSRTAGRSSRAGSASARRASPCRSTSAPKSAGASAGSTSARLAVRQEAYENPFVPGGVVDATTAFVGRVAANVLEESSVGMIVTHGDPSSNLDNTRRRRRLPLSEQPAHRRQVARGRRVVPAIRQPAPRRRRHGVRRRRAACRAIRGGAARSATRASRRTSTRRSASCAARASTKRNFQFGHTWRPRGRAVAAVLLGRECLAHRESRRRHRAEPEREPAGLEPRPELAGRLRHQLLEQQGRAAAAVHGLAAA